MTAQRIRTFLFHNTSLFQTVVKNTFWVSMGQVIGRLLRALLIIYAARLLGAAGYGVFSYALSLAGFFSIFSDIGLTPLLTREGAKNPELMVKYVGTGFTIKLGLIAVNSVIILSALPLLSHIAEANALFPLIALLFAFDSVRDFTFAITRAIEKMQIEAGAFMLTNVTILALGFAALFLFPNVRALLVAYTIGSGIGMVFAVWKVRAYLARFWRAFDRNLIRPILTEAWPFGVSGLLSAIMLSTDTIMIGWLRSTEEIGFYGAAQRMILLLYLLPGFIGVATFPALSRLSAVDRERFGAVFGKTMRVALLMAVPLTVGGILVAPELVRFIFGASYDAAAPVFQVLLLTVTLTFPGMLIGNALFAFGKQWYLVRSFALGAIGNVLLNYAFIPRYGIVGAAVATVITQGLTTAANTYIMQRTHRFRFFAGLSRLLVAAAAMAATVLVARATGAHVLLTVAAGGAAYLGTLYLTGESLIATVAERFRNSTNE